MNVTYILDGKNPVRCDDVIEWAKWFQTADRYVSRTEINGVTVFTVFLGIDHGLGETRPVLYETMVFGSGVGANHEWYHYCTWEDAELGHEEVVRRIQLEQAMPT